MVGLHVKDLESDFSASYLAPFCQTEGTLRSKLFHPSGYSLWELEAELDAGSEVRWGSEHGDEVIYVLDGELEVDGTTCAPRAAAIVEAGVPATARAVQPSRVLHFGPAEADPPTEGVLGTPLDLGRQVHVVGPQDAPRAGSDDGPGAVYYADSSCPTCRVAFFEVSCGSPHVVSSHTHSQDEIIRVMTGQLQVGRNTISAGMSVAIGGGYRYGFRTPGAFSFLNYRRDASLYVAAPGTPPIVEGARAARRMQSGQELG